MTYVTSDLHGYPLEKFQALLDKAGFGEDDFCFVLGDVIDRGKDSVKLLRWLMLQPNFQLILGNHEAMMLGCGFLFEEITEESLRNINDGDFGAFDLWLTNGGDETFDALYECDIDTRLDILNYVKDAPLFDVVTAGGRDFILVHSGLGEFDKNKKLLDYTPDQLLWARPSLNDSYYDDVTTVFGHTPTGLYGPQYVGRALKTPTWINVDTGAASGNAPMLLRLDDMKEFYL